MPGAPGPQGGPGFGGPGGRPGGGPIDPARQGGIPLGPRGAGPIPGALPGGFLQPDRDARDIGDIRGRRREYQEGGATYISEPGRVIVQEDNRVFIRHDENLRFDEFGPVRRERRGGDFVSIVERPGGEEIVTVTDADGRLIRRSRRYRDGREIVIIDNGFDGPLRPIGRDILDLPPPPITIPRDRYIVEADRVPETVIYDTLLAPPLVPIARRYTLDEVRYSAGLRARMRSVDLDTINFDSGSWEVTPDQAQRLSIIAQAIGAAVQRNPREVFLIEGHTDAVGSDVDNLSLSDRRAQSVAAVLTRSFNVPPENLTTQGYGEQYLKVNTQGASRENRRVTVRRITPLIDGGQQ